MVTKTGEKLLYENLTYRIRGACFNIWKEFGGAFKEKVVDRALTEELKSKGLAVDDQKEIGIHYKGKKIATYTPDKIINNLILLEIKCKPFLTKDDERQFWYYLKGSQYKIGFLINFGSKKLEIRRRVYNKARQKEFRVNPRSYPREAQLQFCCSKTGAGRSASTRGFTLIELLVVIAIIFILAVVALPNYKSGQRQYALERSAHKLAQDIRRAQEWAMSMKKCEKCSGGKEFPKAYGVYLEPGNNFYILYAELDGNEFYQSTQDVIEETNFLETGVKIDKIYVPPNDNRPKGCINFRPPDPEIEIKYGGGVTEKGEEIQITLVLESDPAKTKIVKANKGGAITVE